MVTKDYELVAHLMRRAGFGASKHELKSLVEKGYDQVVEQLFDSSETPNRMSDNMVRRYHPDYSGLMGSLSTAGKWFYSMLSTDAPLRDKVSLMWHGIFATGYSKLANGKVLHDQVRMFERNGMGSFQKLLIELSKDPAMIIWLDNIENHKGAVNENYGRELLELFTMGTGNYSEQDVKEAARAFTGWTIGNADYMALKSARDSIWPYGRLSMHFEYNPEDHDDGEKEFLGNKGRFNGEDIIDIICKQPATAKFIARHMYSFFVADEAPVPEWPYKPPRDSEAISALCKVYFDSNYSIKEMLRFLFKSEFFKSEAVRYQRVKSPAELVATVLKVTGELDRPKYSMIDRAQNVMWMGQQLLAPPSVEGWHWGTEWIDSGSLVERVNFASQALGDLENPGVSNLVDRILKENTEGTTFENILDKVLEELAITSTSEQTKSALLEFGQVYSEKHVIDGENKQVSREYISEVLKLVGAMPEFQRA